MDESELFYRTLPRYTIMMPDKDVSTVRGKKKVKDILSLVVCTIATGSHKIPCAMIAKAKKPAYIVGQSWSVPCFSQMQAWMDVETYWH